MDCMSQSLITCVKHGEYKMGVKTKKKLLIQEYAFVKSKSTLTESTDKKGHSIIEGEFGMVDEKNANNRIYPREIMEREVKIFNESLGGRGVLGELDHPEDGKTKLVRSSHVIEKLSINEDGKIIGRARIIPTDMGRNLLALYESGAPVGISSRGYGSTMTTDEGVDIVQPDFELKTFDFVEDPSAGVYPELVTESVDDNGKTVIETIANDKKGEVLKTLGIKNEAVLDDEGDDFDEKEQGKTQESDDELESGTEAEAEENKDIESSQSDTSSEIRSKMDGDDEKTEGTESEYQAFLASKLKEMGHDSIADIPADKKDEFFNMIDKEYTGEKDVNESSEEHIKKGYKTITGKVLSDEEVKAYNSLTDKINSYVKSGRKVPEELLNGRHNLFYQSGMKGESKLESAKAQLNVVLNQISKATTKLESIKAGKGDSVILEAIKEVLAPTIVEGHLIEKYKALEEANAKLEEENRDLREDNEIHTGRNRKLAESLDRTVRRLYLEQALNEIGVHNEDVFFEDFKFESHDSIQSLKEGIKKAKAHVKKIYGENYFTQEALVENTQAMIEKGKDLEGEVKELTEQNKSLNKNLLFEQRKQVVARDLEKQGLLEGYTNKNELIEMIAKKEKSNLLETKKVIKESGVAFQKVPEYNNEKRAMLKRSLKGFNSEILENELDTPSNLNENINGVNMKDFKTLAGV